MVKTGKRKTGKGKAVKKEKTNVPDAREEALKKAPHTFVFHRGHVGKSVLELESDLRRVMEPFTASRLKVRKKNVLKDFVSIAGPLNVSHFMVLSKTKLHIQLRLIRLPRGPTITFRVHRYSLSKDIVSSLKHHNMEPKQFQHHPLLVMNNFSGDGMHLKLMATMFQNMLPSINISKVKLSQIRRCVLLNYNPDSQTLDFRHYNVRAVPVGMSRGIKKLVKAKVPNLSNFEDVSEFLMRGGDASESEAELDGDQNEVILPQKMAGRGNIKSAKSAIRLTEIGPRLKLEVMKIEDGIGDGEVLYHQFIKKTEEEVQTLRELKAKKKLQKSTRRKKQEENVKKKEKKKEEMKEKSLAGMKLKNDDKTKDESSDNNQPSDNDDDVEYFRQEVGEEPEQELFPSRQPKLRGFKRKGSKTSYGPTKKRNKGEQFSKFDSKKEKRQQNEKKQIMSDSKISTNKKFNKHNRKLPQNRDSKNIFPKSKKSKSIGRRKK